MFANLALLPVVKSAWVSAQEKDWIAIGNLNCYPFNSQQNPIAVKSLHKDGSYTLEIPYSDDRELLGDILLFGPDVEVVGPKQLRDKVALAVKKTLKIYEQ